MKMIPVNVELPKPVDEFFKKEARRRFVSKAAVIREVLMKHVSEVSPVAEPQPVP